jgi:hypothetical protein
MIIIVFWKNQKNEKKYNLLLNNVTKLIREMSSYQLIYGAVVRKEKVIKIIPPFQKFVLPNRDGADHYFIGFPFAKINKRNL